MTVYSMEVRVIVDLIKQSGLLISLKKCEILQEEIAFLGRMVTEGKTKTSPTRSACIRDMPKPTTFKGVQRVLGIFGYMRTFIYRFSEIAQPLYDMLVLDKVPKEHRKRNGQAKPSFIVTWTAEADESYEQLKKLTTQSLELHQPDFSHPMKLATDASEKG